MNDRPTKIQKGDLIFSRSNTCVSKLIRFKTLSNWSHVGICIGHSSNKILQKLIKSYGYDLNDANDFLILAAEFKGVTITTFSSWFEKYEALACLKPSLKNKSNVDVIINIAITELNKKYDFLGLLDFVTFNKYQNSKRWFCSELISYIFKTAGEDLFNGRKDTAFTSPADIYENPKLKLIWHYDNG